jgi:hypothetical protein
MEASRRYCAELRAVENVLTSVYLCVSEFQGGFREDAGEELQTGPVQLENFPS